MAITSPVVCTREDVKAELDFKESARNNLLVDRKIEAATVDVEKLLHRKFYPQVATRYFDWPNFQYAWPWRLYLGSDELISATTVTVGGVALAPGDYFLEPANSGPPYTRIDIDLSSAASFTAGDTWQRSIAISGVFGHSANETPAGVLAEDVDLTETAVNVSDSASIGVGSIIKVGTERMLVSEKTMLDTGQDLATPMTAAVANTSCVVADGTAFTVGETILLDSERMLVVDIAGNTLTVKRAWDGTVLAAHTAPSIYAPRTLAVTRGALGTTAATHTTADAITCHVVPSLVRELGVAEATNLLLQGASGYARTIGAGDYTKESSGSGLANLRDQVWSAYGRKNRIRAV